MQDPVVLPIPEYVLPGLHLHPVEFAIIARPTGLSLREGDSLKADDPITGRD